MKKFIEIIELFFVYYGLFKLPKDQFRREAFELNSNYELRPLLLVDLDHFKNLESRSKNISLYEKYFSSEDYECFGVFEKSTNTLVYSAWINYSNSFFLKEINRIMNFHRGESALFYDDYTHSDHRGLGIHKYVMHQRILHCFEHGIKTVYIVIHMKNKPALKTVKCFGFRRVNYFPIYYRRGSFNEFISLLRKKLKA